MELDCRSAGVSFRGSADHVGERQRLAGVPHCHQSGHKTVSVPDFIGLRSVFPKCAWESQWIFLSLLGF